MIRQALCICCMAVVALVQETFSSDTCSQQMLITNGVFNTIVPDGDRVYVGGKFSLVSQYTGAWIHVSTGTGDVVPDTLTVNGSVSGVCDDSAGGWFIGGEFTHIDGILRVNIAHILADGNLDVECDAHAEYGNYLDFHNVKTLFLSWEILYVGGYFESMGGKDHRFIVALDATTGNVADWNPDADNYVTSLAMKGNTLYVGGVFDTISGQPRSNIAFLDTVTGLATDWNPGAEYVVQTLAITYQLPINRANPARTGKKQLPINLSKMDRPPGDPDEMSGRILGKQRTGYT